MMPSIYGFSEVKQRLLGAITAAELAGFNETAEELRLLLKNSMLRNDKTLENQSHLASGLAPGSPDTQAVAVELR